MESVLLFRNAQMPVAGVPDRNRCRLHRDNAKQEVPGMKEFRQNKCILHTPVQQAFDDLTNVWDVMFPVERYKFINEVVEKITVHIDRVEIEYKTDGLEAVITETEASNGKND